MTVDIQAMREMLAKASTQDWRRCGCGKCALVWVTDESCMSIRVSFGDDEGDISQEKADFVAAAQNQMPALLSELESARARIAALESALTTASTMKMHWSSRKHQAEFKRLLGDKK